MFNKSFIKTYLLRATIAAAIYSITVIIFLIQKQFQSIWLLFLGNALYMIAIAGIVYINRKMQKFSGSPVTSAISGHILSLTGAVLSVIISLLLYFLFYVGIDGSKSEVLQHAPAEMRANAPNNGIIFVLIVVAALGNTITGFFAAIFTSFGSSKNKLSEQRS